MSSALTLAALAALCLYGYVLGARRSVAMVGGHVRELHSLPFYHGGRVVLWTALPALMALLLWLGLEGWIVRGLVVASLPDSFGELPTAEAGLILDRIFNLAAGIAAGAEPTEPMRDAAILVRRLRSIGDLAMFGAVVAVAAGGLFYARSRIAPDMRVRNAVERIVMGLLILCSTIAILTTIGIVASLLFESFRFFTRIPPADFLFGLQWSPQTAIRSDQIGSSGAFGAVPLFVGTLLISFIALLVAVPIGLMAATYLSDYATPKVRAWVKPLLEILAGVPTVVYGFFAALTVAPLFRGIGDRIGLDVASESALAAGVVMGIMIVPFVSSLSDDVIAAVPNALREGAYGLGSTKSECICRIVIPAALPGLFAAVMLAASRAIGETMIVVMAAGLAAPNMAEAPLSGLNPLEAVTTVTVQIVTLLVGDQAFDSPKTLAAFALGLMLFAVTLCMNVAALVVVRKYREKYD